ncbi:S1 RNA-binding domain-containing protein [Lactobacillus bombicola]|uniref:RNA-binding protein n=1 Tax=Lactobacillus bombicola TaxID=1505723 RepID=A0A396SRK7_9LACO|nr:S1 RNA-binding domain-containing protein [Lactobacillus bombicola]RHW54084.1 RNA-binding protein [Lactobacillus bombicola]
MKYQVGQRITGVINKITDLGIFVTLPKNKFGLIHHKDFGTNWLHERQNYHSGQAIRVVVIHNYRGKISLSKMRVNDSQLIDQTNDFLETKKENFLSVLAETVSNSQTEIKKLEQELVIYAT